MAHPHPQRELSNGCLASFWHFIISTVSLPELGLNYRPCVRSYKIPAESNCRIIKPHGVLLLPFFNQNIWTADQSSSVCCSGFLQVHVEVAIFPRYSWTCSPSAYCVGLFINFYLRTNNNELACKLCLLPGHPHAWC